MKIAALCGRVEVDNKMKKRQIASQVLNAPIGDSYISRLFVSLTGETKRIWLVYSG